MIPFPKTCEGFGLLPGKWNILLEIYNILRNEVVEKKRCFTVVFLYFAIGVPIWVKCRRMRLCGYCGCGWDFQPQTGVRSEPKSKSFLASLFFWNYDIILNVFWKKQLMEGDISVIKKTILIEHCEMKKKKRIWKKRKMFWIIPQSNKHLKWYTISFCIVNIDR